LIFTNYTELIAQIQQKIKSTKEYTKNIPIFINTRDRFSCVNHLIDWLSKNGYTNIVIIDNASTYPILVEFLKECPYPVIRLKKNLGHTALWMIKAIRPIIRKEWFVYTDPDVVPIETCPSDVITHFYKILNRHPEYVKVGLGLLLNDIPDHYHLKRSVITWESNLYGREIEPEVFEADVDTTFALYRPKVSYTVAPALRTLGNYQARHLPWYIDSEHIDEEEQYYRNHAIQYITHWNISGTSKHEKLNLRGGTTAVWSSNSKEFFLKLINSKSFKIATFFRKFRNIHYKTKIDLEDETLSDEQIKIEIMRLLTSDDWLFATQISSLLVKFKEYLHKRR